MTTWEGTEDVKTFTIEDDGKTVTVYVGEIFRILLPADDYSYNNDLDFSSLGWVEENYMNTNFFENMSFGIASSGYEQENYY